MASRSLQYIAPMSTTPLQCVDIHIRHEITASPCNGYRHTRINIHAAKKKTFYNHLFFYYHQVWIGKDQSDQSQNGHFFTPMTTEPMLSTEKEGLLHNIVNISFYGKLLFFTTIKFGSRSTHHGSVTE